MALVTILGAGDMGTALVTPLTRNGHRVRLLGTFLDAEIVATLRSGGKHPRLQIALPLNASAHPVEESAAAFHDALLIVIAITSDAVRPVLRELAPWLGQPRAIVTVAKGFDSGPDGTTFQFLPETITEFSSAPVVAVGGPSKANEVANNQPTAVNYASSDSEALALACRVFQTLDYRIKTTDDVAGLEIAAGMKNAYAIALGIADGLELRSGDPHHNLRAALFPFAVAEMVALARAFGGRAETVLGLAGAGDLLVTITSGRNRQLGERIGAGEPPLEAVQSLTQRGTTIEGYAAIAFGHRIHQDAIFAGTIEEGELPLLDALWRIVYHGADARSALVRIL